jgi:hypothetical protein
MKYKVTHKGQEAGDFTLDEIAAKVRSKELELFDYLFDATADDWVLLMEHRELAMKLKSNKPPRPSTANAATSVKAEISGAGTGTTTGRTAKHDTHDVGDWFVLKGEHRFGPFSVDDVVRMLQQKVVFPFDFVWHAGLKDWTRCAEIEDFKPENIRALFEKSSKKSELFVPRKFKRKKHSGRVIIHDNITLWKGEATEISKGGLGVMMKNAIVVPGQQVFAHVTGSDGLPSFNAVCEVVSKKFVNDSSPVEYGLRFISLSQDAQDEFFKKVT